MTIACSTSRFGYVFGDAAMEREFAARPFGASRQQDPKRDIAPAAIQDDIGRFAVMIRRRSAIADFGLA